MSDHDALCAYTLPEQDRDPHDHCTCDRLFLARADERERGDYAGPCWDGCIHNDAHIAALEARDHELAHAEAVAARLVEVICEDADALRHVHTAWRKTNRGYIEVENERDAARAEVAALREQVTFLERHVNAEIDAGREVLADLRAKIQAERDEDARYVHRDDSASVRIDAYSYVLALIEEGRPHG